MGASLVPYINFISSYNNSHILHNTEEEKGYHTMKLLGRLDSYQMSAAWQYPIAPYIFAYKHVIAGKQATGAEKIAHWALSFFEAIPGLNWIVALIDAGLGRAFDVEQTADPNLAMLAEPLPDGMTWDVDAQGNIVRQARVEGEGVEQKADRYLKVFAAAVTAAVGLMRLDLPDDQLRLLNQAIQPLHEKVWWFRAQRIDCSRLEGDLQALKQMHYIMKAARDPVVTAKSLEQLDDAFLSLHKVVQPPLRLKEFLGEWQSFWQQKATPLKKGCSPRLKG